MSRPLRLAVSGHVDHGKSTVIGRLLSDTGQVREDRLRRVQAQCANEGRRFEFAFLLDALEEEQQQGITIDVTEVAFVLNDREFTIIDTPGHREFLKNMIGGASRADAAILVVDVSEALHVAFRAQVAVMAMLGIARITVLLNKMDLVNYAEDVFALRSREIQTLFGDAGLNAPQVIPVAAWAGVNLLERAANQTPWYSGPTLGEALSALPAPRDLAQAPLRFPLQDVYKFDDRRIYVGRVESGTLDVGDAIEFWPSGRRSVVRSLEGQASGQPGDAIGITLADSIYLERGEIGCAPSHAPRAMRALDVDLFWLAPQPVSVGRVYTLKCGQSERRATVTQIKSVLDPATLTSTAQAQISDGAIGRLRVHLDRPLAADLFSESESTGRFVLVDEFRVCGGGRILADATTERENRAGLVIWLTGLSGAGKSTLANQVAERLRNHARSVLVLDGDVVRQGLCRDLGYFPADRAENVRRVAEVAKLFADTGGIVVTALISPYAADRRHAREIIGAAFAEVFVDCSLEECERRDAKGLYRRARAGELPGFTGVDAPFERPMAPDLYVNSKFDSAIAIAEQVQTFIKARLQFDVV